jgi:2-methylcitrate dehydratase PrpD
MAAMSGIGMWEMGGSSSAGFLTALGMRSGLASWQAAKAGFEAPKGAIDGKFGSFRAYTGKAPEVIREQLLSLGDAWATSDILFQPYSGDTFTQAPLVALKSLRDALGDRVDRSAIDKIVVHVSARTAAGVAHKSARHTKIPDALAFNSDPKSRVAAGWLHGIYSFDQGWDHLIGDAEIEDLRERVEFCEESAIEPISSARVELHFGDGSREKTETISFPGSAENPMSDEQLEEAFRAMAYGKLSDRRCDHIIDEIWELEASSDMAGLFAEISAAIDV